MTEQEKAALKAEIKAETINELIEAGMLKCSPAKKRPLEVPYNKWFSNDGEKKMLEAFTQFDKWKVWENVRTLTRLIVGVNQVSNIPADGKAVEICEKLCQFVYDLRKEYQQERKEREQQ